MGCAEVIQKNGTVLNCCRIGETFLYSLVYEIYIEEGKLGVKSFIRVFVSSLVSSRVAPDVFLLS